MVLRAVKSLAAAFVIVIAHAGGSAAATPGAAQPATRERLTARVDEFWKAWQAKDVHRLFLLQAPSYRKTVTESAFGEATKGLLPIVPVSYTVAKLDMSQDGRRAAVELAAKVAIAPFGETSDRQIQQWVYEGDDWYRVPEPSAFPSAAPGTALTTPAAGLAPPSPGASPPTAKATPRPSPPSSPAP